MPWLRLGTLVTAAVLGLSACGGDERRVAAPELPPVTELPATPQEPATPATPRALVISLDGATYAAVQRGMAAQALPQLAQLEVHLAYSGGIAGTPSQQPTLDAPGWATLLTGMWASRHRVMSSAPNQALHGDTVFQRLKDRNAGRSGAAVASKGLAQMLASEHAAGYLDTLSSCAAQGAATDCVTTAARQMIEGDYRTVVAQYHAASDAVLNHGLGSKQYADTLARLDQAVGQLVAATAARKNERWLITVTGNHGFSLNSQDDGLPLLPQSTTFMAINQPVNNGMLGLNAAEPSELKDLYAYNSLADVAPTLLGHLQALPQARDYQLDGAALVGPRAVSKLKAAVLENNSPNVRVALEWEAPSDGTVSILREGAAIATRLPAGTRSFTDLDLAQALTAQGSAALNYTLVIDSDQAAAARAILTSPITYVPPVPLATTLRNGLVSYYPFSDRLPPVDAIGNSRMAAFSPALDPQAGLVVPGPFAGTHGLLVDTNYATVEGLEGYKLTPNAGFDVSQGAAPQFTLGFWFNTPQCVDKNNVTLVSNKNYVSGANAGVAIGLFGGTGGQCGVAFNIGSGGARADGPTSPYTQITENRWVYIAFSLDGVAKTMNMYVYDSVTGTINRVAQGKSTGSVDLSKLSAYPQWGIGADGTGAFLMNKCNGTVKPPYQPGKCTTAPTFQHKYGDLAMWNRVLSDAELESIFLSNKPLSSLSSH
ncbi:alkaline phosphatase family protein [Comamonas antarctica]|uniref:Alkaline phosphatase family protein n=1 Tax=Comamonas antarctica TaxID=2743470 RepID=A0A6N1X7Z9_9BURK|nr:alkaline phosphatase family protein [Comamonas antarctica]QKV55477.1 alkaline phosphatase family protein [Comamonas antarctica]